MNQHRNFNYDTQIDLRGAKVALNMVRDPLTGNKVLDLSSYGNDATISGKVRPSKMIGGIDALDFGSVGLITVPKTTEINTMPIYSYSFLLKTNTSKVQYIIEKGIVVLYLNSSNPSSAVVSCNYTPTIGTWSFSNSILQGKWHHVVITHDTLNDPTGLKLYINGEAKTRTGGTNPVGTRVSDAAYDLIVGAYHTLITELDGSIADFCVYDRVLSSGEILAQYKKYAKLPYFIDDLSDANTTLAVNGVSNYYLSNTDWRIYSGTWNITSDTDGKHIANVTAGTIYQQSTQAYGTWEFIIKDTAQLNNSIMFMGVDIFTKVVTGNNGYLIYLTSTGTIKLARVTNGNVAAWIGAEVSISGDELHKIIVTRNHTGLFNVYVDGLLKITGTDTTYTASKYFSIYRSAKNLVYSVVIREGVFSP